MSTVSSIGFHLELTSVGNFCDDITCWRFRMYNSYGAGASMPLAQLWPPKRMFILKVPGMCWSGGKMSEFRIAKHVEALSALILGAWGGDDNGPGTSRHVGHGRFNATASEKDTWQKMLQSDVKHFLWNLRNWLLKINVNNVMRSTKFGIRTSYEFCKTRNDSSS